MWLFTRYGFFSVAVFRDLVVLRARKLLHLENLRRRFRSRIGRRRIAETKLKDYRWRLTLGMGAWLGLLAEIAGEQTWDNFKAEAAAYGAVDGDYLGLLDDLWAELVRYQNAPKTRVPALFDFELGDRKDVLAEDA